MKNKKKTIIASCFIVTVFLATVASARIDITDTWHPEGGGDGGGDPFFNATDTEAELEAHLVDVTDIFTDNDGALDDDDVTLADVQDACANDFHNIGGTDATDDTVSGTELDALLFGANGLLRKTGANTFDTVIDNSAEWDTAYGWGSHFWNRASTTLYPKTDGDNIQVNGTSYFNDTVTIDANATIGNWKAGWNPGKLYFGPGISATYIGLSNTFPTKWEFHSEFPLYWYLDDLLFEGNELFFSGNYTQFGTKNNENMQFDVEGGELRYFADEYIFNCVPGGDICGDGNVSFYNSVGGGTLLMYIPGNDLYINISVNTNISENLTVLHNITTNGYFIGNGSKLTGLPSGFTYSDWFNQKLNTTDDVTFNSIVGNGSGLWWLNWNNLVNVPSGLTPGGSSGQMQYNNSGSFDGAYYYNDGNMTSSLDGTWGYYEDDTLIVIGNLSYVSKYKD